MKVLSFITFPSQDHDVTLISLSAALRHFPVCVRWMGIWGIIGCCILSAGCTGMHSPSGGGGGGVCAGNGADTDLYIADAHDLVTFVNSSAILKPTSNDDAALRMAAMADTYLTDSDRLYTEGTLERPDIRYFTIDLPGRSLESYYLVALPDEWETQDVHKAIVFSQGHGSRTPVGFSKLHRYADAQGMACIMPQLWIEGDAPQGYEPYHPSQKDRLEGLPAGYHLDATDEYPFLNAVAEEYGIDSAYLFGFSISGAKVMAMSAYDHMGDDIVDFTVVSGGTMGYDHCFLQTMERCGCTDFFAGENFFFYGELKGGISLDDARETSVTEDIITEHGGTLVMEEWQEGAHGSLLNSHPELMKESFLRYHAIADERLSCGFA